MWNILIVIIIAIILFALNPLGKVNLSSPTQVDQKTQNEVNQVLNQTEQQINQARELQKQEFVDLNKN